MINKKATLFSLSLLVKNNFLPYKWGYEKCFLHIMITNGKDIFQRKCEENKICLIDVWWNHIWKPEPNCLNRRAVVYQCTIIRVYLSLCPGISLSHSVSLTLPISLSHSLTLSLSLCLSHSSFWLFLSDSACLLSLSHFCLTWSTFIKLNSVT
mgnify:CR=1 FL=1